MHVCNLNVTADCHVNPQDFGYTGQFVHGNFQGGDLTYRNLRLRAPCPSGSITLMRTAVIEHQLLDWVPRMNETWQRTYRFSHPITFPRSILGSIKKNQGLMNKYRGGSWASTSLGLAPRRVAEVDFDPAKDISLLNTSSAQAHLLYAGHASMRDENHPDHMRDAILALLGDYDNSDQAPVEARYRQQRDAGKCRGTDKELRAVLERHPIRRPTASRTPVLDPTVVPTPIQVAKFAANFPLPTTTRDEGDLKKWWFEVRQANALSEQEYLANPQRRFSTPTVTSPTVTPIGQEISFLEGPNSLTSKEISTAKRKGKAPVYAAGYAEEAAPAPVAAGAATRPVIRHTVPWILKWNGSRLEIMPQDIARALVARNRRRGPIEAQRFLEVEISKKRVGVFLMPETWMPGQRAEDSQGRNRTAEFINFLWADQTRNPGSPPDPPQVYTVTCKASELPQQFAYLATKTHRTLKSLTAWDYWGPPISTPSGSSAREPIVISSPEMSMGSSSATGPS